MFYSWCYFNLATRSPSSLGRSPWQLCHVISIWVHFIIQVWKFGDTSLQKFGRFYTTSNFDREYLWNESGKPKLERHVIETDSSRVQQKKSGELLFTNYKVGHVSLDPPKRTILEDYIPPLVVVTPKIFTHTSDWPRHASARHNNLKGKHLKFLA